LLAHSCRRHPLPFYGTRSSIKTLDSCRFLSSNPIAQLPVVVAAVRLSPLLDSLS
jgi:hypothetical protein